MGDWRAAEQTASAQFGVISRGQLKGVKLGEAAVRHAVRSGRLVPLTRAVLRFATAPVTWMQVAFAVTRLAVPEAAASHFTAAWLWRLPDVPEPTVESLHVSVPRDCGVELAGVTLHHPKNAFVACLVNQVRVTRIARTLVDLAPDVEEAKLERMLDAAHLRFYRLADWLKEELQPLKAKQPGVALLRHLLASRLGQSALESPLETDTARVLRRLGVPVPTTQFEVHTPEGERIACPDFAWPDRKVALFVDSRLWHSSRHALDNDAAQRTRLIAYGWKPLVVTQPLLENAAWQRSLQKALEVREEREFSLTQLEPPAWR